MARDYCIGKHSSREWILFVLEEAETNENRDLELRKVLAGLVCELKPQLSVGSLLLLSRTQILPVCIQMTFLLSSVHRERTGTNCLRRVRHLADVC